MKNFLTVSDVCILLDLKKSAAQKRIALLNEELSSKGYNIVKGRINKRYFAERYYLSEEEVDKKLFGGEMHAS
ncbi:hypothetical protein [Listeria fleischmannii]|uniref:DNA-binding protein n=1 Tax=Listeria fleischmannii FSL S10-1203 TaxID=1265822 RepID=W7DLX6_9LIST|nr:hypothetical protein [Listeria fleischmannii]EUJ48696.1 hypothetical protein MCOL2_17162 [Listeria fleischmannii FSL S10-1203]